MPCESIQGQQEEPQYDCLPPSNKRHKFFLSTLHGCVSYDVTISPHDNESSPPEADKENQWRLQNEARHDVIWNQVDRMQRMSLYLKNAQLAQELFLRELKDYLATVGQRE